MTALTVSTLTACAGMVVGFGACRVMWLAHLRAVTLSLAGAVDASAKLIEMTADAVHLPDADQRAALRSQAVDLRKMAMELRK